MGLWMEVGTVAVTNGSKQVTGTGTNFLSAVVPARPGQPITLNGTMYEIERVETDTELWLVKNYAGATAATLAYSIMTTMEGSFNDLARRSAQVMGYWQGYLDDLEELFTGTGTITVTTPTGEVVQLPTWGTMQPKDSTLTTLSGKPTSTFGMARLADADAAAQRTVLGVKKAGLVDILGTLTAPDENGLTSAIIERGSNVNGGYVKFADGTMITTSLTFRGAATFILHNANIGSYGWSFYTSTAVNQPFPAVFAVPPSVCVGGASGSGGVSSVEGITTSGCGYSIWTIGANNYNCTTIAIGRWF